MAITIQTQPNTFGISYARSPIIYRYVNCNPNYNYQFNLYITNKSISNLNTIYSFVSRVPDLVNGITVDISSMVQNYITNQIDLYKENVVYVLSTLAEYNGTTYNDLITSNVSRMSLGYNNQVGSYGVFNYNEAYYNTTETEYLMNSIKEDVPYYIPNFGFGRFTLSWKKALSLSNKYNIIYTNTGGTLTTISYNMSVIIDAPSEVETIHCGYYDLGVFWNKIDVDISKNITIKFLKDTTVLHNYILSPISCNGNDLINIQFMNKWGVWEHFFCYGRIDTQIDSTSEVYKYNNVNYSSMEYNPNLGSYHKHLSQGKYKMILNTGWIDQQQNEKITQLLLSEFVVIDNNVGDVIPIIITDKSMKFKTTKFDKMINYTFNADIAYDEINNII